ncbi:MAG: phosphoribosyltransferase family protein [Myxococcota bacterium]
MRIYGHFKLETILGPAESVQITADLTAPIEGRNVVIVEDIVDTGLSMRYLLENFRTRRPKSVKVCTMLHKPDNSQRNVTLDYVGFRIPNAFVVGYGLDLAGEYRNLPLLEFTMDKPKQAGDETGGRPVKPTKGPIRRFAGWLVVRLLILGLLATVIFLLSQLNHGKYRLREEAGVLLVERGRLLPMGFEAYIPTDNGLKQAYAPLDMPNGVTLGEPLVFNERGEMDQTLFSLLGGWARREMEGKDNAAVERSTEYIVRADRLPGISEEQRGELRTLRADLAYRNGRMVDQVVDLLKSALKEFETSIELGTTRRDTAMRWIAEINRRIDAYRQTVGDPRFESENPNPSELAPKLPTNDVAPDDKIDATPADRHDPQAAPRTKDGEPPPAKWRL